MGAARVLSGKRVVVAGLGRSGMAAVRLLVREGAHVIATDVRPREAFAGKTPSPVTSTSIGSPPITDPSTSPGASESTKAPTSGQASTSGRASTSTRAPTPGEASAFPDPSTSPDANPVLRELDALAAQGVRLELGGHVLESFTSADLVVKSPGIPPSVPEIAAARRAGVPVIGEVELCGPFLTGPVVAVTGTNGKSTTTALVGHLLSFAGRRPFVGGNLGIPVADHVLTGRADADATVLELSSYQVDDLDSFQVDIAVILNLTPDHLERYGTMEAYGASKGRLLDHVRDGGVCILGTGSPPIAAMRERVGQGRRLVTFENGDPVDGEMRALGTTVFRGREERYGIRAVSLRGDHNVANAMAAIEVARLLGLTPEQVQSGLDTYAGLPHRLEVVRVVNGVEWINDSKATNVDSVEKSLSALPGPLHLVMGGAGKGASYAPLRHLFPGRVTRLYLVGEEAGAIHRELGDLVPVEHAGTLDVAVARASRHAVPGECVLLSPACASFDQFTSFEHRGNVFRRLVESLDQEVSSAAC